MISITREKTWDISYTCLEFLKFSMSGLTDRRMSKGNLDRRKRNGITNLSHRKLTGSAKSHVLAENELASNGHSRRGPGSPQASNRFDTNTITN